MKNAPPETSEPDRHDCWVAKVPAKRRCHVHLACLGLTLGALFLLVACRSSAQAPEVHRSSAHADPETEAAVATPLPDDALARQFMGLPPSFVTSDGVIVYGDFTDSEIEEIRSAVRAVSPPDQVLLAILRMRNGNIEAATGEGGRFAWSGYEFILRRENGLLQVVERLRWWG